MNLTAGSLMEFTLLSKIVVGKPLCNLPRGVYEIVEAKDIKVDVRKRSAANSGGRSAETQVNHFLGNSQGFKNLRALVAL